MLTLHDVAERLKRMDEITLLEVLDISSEEIVDRFEDLIKIRYNYLVEDLSDDSDYTYDLDLDENDEDYYEDEEEWN